MPLIHNIRDTFFNDAWLYHDDGMIFMMDDIVVLNNACSNLLYVDARYNNITV
jgi:hypothetical protein